MPVESNAPSAKSLIAAFKISAVAARIIRKQFHEVSATAGLRRADIYLPTHGIETIYDTNGKAVLKYLNTGETYNTTLCYNVRTGYVFIGNWGDFVERYTRKYHIA